MKRAVALIVVVLFVMGNVAAYAAGDTDSSTQKNGWQKCYDDIASWGAADSSTADKTKRTSSKQEAPKRGTEVSTK